MARQRQRTRRTVTEEGPVTEAAPEVQEEAAVLEAEAPKAEEVVEEPTRQRKPRGEAVVDEPVEVDAAGLLQAMFEGLSDGKPVVINKTKSGAYVVSHAEAAPVKATISKRGYKEEEFWSDEYKEFRGWWTPMSAEEKEAYAKENDVTWDVHDNALVNNIRLSEAVQTKLGISKYKAGFEDRNARILGVPATS